MAKHQGVILSDTEAATVRELCERIGERAARERLGVSHQTLARAVGRMHVQRGTAHLIRCAISANDNIAVRR